LPEQILIWSGIYNTCIWIRSSIPIKHYLLIVIEFFSELKVSCGLSNNNHCKLLMANVLQWKQGPMLVRRLWWGWSHTVVGHLFWNAELLFHKKVVTTKYLAKFQSQMAVSWPKIIQLEWISKLICNLWLYTHTKNQVNISNHSEIKWCQLNIWPNFKAQWLQVGQRSFNWNKFQSRSVTYDYTLSYQKSSQYFKS
jgi:hypothetical protein